MQKLLIATQNKGKLREYKEIFADLPYELVSLADVGLGDLDVDETGDTFMANALLKAEAYAKAANMLTLADDSGLCVNALDGAPGVYSARYAGEGASDHDRRAKLLDALQSVPDEKRGAHFECAVVVYDPSDERQHTAVGICAGTIAHAESDGQYGFGYDALFIPEDYTITLAEIEPKIKNDLSHRGRAARQMRQRLTVE